MNQASFSRRDLLALGAAGTASLAASVSAADPSTQTNSTTKPTAAPDKVYRIGVISASIEGKPQRVNGHTWHFCHPFHPTVDLNIVKKYKDPGSAKIFETHFRNPKMNFDLMPFADTRLTHFYDPDETSCKMFAEGFPGVQIAKSVEQMCKEVDAVWLGDASGTGHDHLELIAPALEAGLPTFCDKPIGKTVAGTRAILDLAKKHKAPLMSSSLFRHQWGTAEALRLRDSGEFGPLQYVIASQAGGWTLPSWHIYGQHPVWMVMTLCGPGVEGVSMYARENTCHALISYPDRMPAEVWYGRPDIYGLYCETSAHFQKKKYTWTPAIEDNYWYGHSYQIMKMAYEFKQMIVTGKEPVPHQEILEVTAIIHAAAKSLNEKNRTVALAEVM